MPLKAGDWLGQNVLWLAAQSQLSLVLPLVFIYYGYMYTED